MTKLRLSIFMPANNAFYERVLTQMKRGFESHGVECTGSLGLLRPDEMKRWCDTHRPHVVFEMNRSARDVPFLPREVRHVAWIVDLGGEHPDYYQGSAITYFFMYVPRVTYLPGLRKGLGPGACPYDYPAGELVARMNASFVGHIPNPWSEAELDRDVTGGRGRLKFRDLIPVLEEVLNRNKVFSDVSSDIDSAWHTRRHNKPIYTLEAPQAAVLRDAAEQYCLETSGVPLVVDDRLAYDIDGRLVRHVNRCEIADLMLQASRGFGVFGPEQWTRWPRYAPHYRGWLNDAAELHRAYQSSAANLHEGVGLHFRSMDIMSSGGLLLFRRSEHDYHDGGIHRFFEEDVHFVAFVPGDFGDKLAHYLADPSAAQTIRTNAAREIAARHTWSHRAAEILEDLRAVG